MTDSSDDSADTVISVFDSHLSQSLTTSDSLSTDDSPPVPEPPDSEKLQNSDVMGNRHGGEKKKKEDTPQEKKPEDKPKKKGKKSKGKSKRNSQNAEGNVPSGLGACASPSCSTTKDKPRSKSKRPDVLADLGAHAPGSPLGSPESASGSQGTWSYDDESDVSTLGYSTPLLSTPQVQRYVIPKQTTPQQNSTERLEELGRSIERNIIDKLSGRQPEEGAAAAPTVCTATGSSTDKKGKRNVKKKRALGQAVIDSDSFSIPFQDVRSDQSAGRSPKTQRLNVGTEKICLRASQESTVSPWLRDDDTPVDEEQMDEMFISCIDLSYNLADICSEKEFTEYGSLDSKKHSRPEKRRAKETSLSPRIARKPVQIQTPWPKVPQEIKSVDSRDTPPKSDSSTSTLAEVGRDTIQEAGDFEENIMEKSQEQTTELTENIQSTMKESADILKPTSTVTEDPSCMAAGKHPQVKKKTGKSKSKNKSKKKNTQEAAAPVAIKELDIPKKSDSTVPTGLDSLNDSFVDEHADLIQTDGSRNTEKTDESCVSEVQEYVNSVSQRTDTVSESIGSDYSALTTDSISEIKDTDGSIQSNSEVNLSREESNQEEIVSTKCDMNDVGPLSSDIGPEDKSKDQTQTESESLQSNEQSQTKTHEKVDRVPNASESLSPPESASPRHVPPPSPSAMDALAEVDEADEEAMEAQEENSQLREVQLFGETVFKRLSSLVESQSQDEDMEDRFNDFKDSGDMATEETGSPPVNLGSMTLVNGNGTETPDPGLSDVTKDDGNEFPRPEVVEEAIIPGSAHTFEKSIVDIVHENDDRSQISSKEVTESDLKDDKDIDDVDEGTLKRKKKKSKQKKNKSKKDPQGNVVKRPEIPAELKQFDNNRDNMVSKLKTDDKSGIKDESGKENTPPKRESQQIQEVIDAYGLGDIVDVCVERLPSDHVKQNDSIGVRPQYESDEDDDEDDDSDSSCESRSPGHPSSSSLELFSRRIPDIEETFSELLSVKNILEDFEDRTPTEETLPSFIGYDELRSPPECGNGRRSRMSPAITDRTESDLDISEQRDDISTDSMYADDEDDGVSEVLFSRSYSEPDGNEVVVSCTFYNTQHNNTNTTDSDDFWEDYTTADESFKQIEISADAASLTFQNARKQMQDIHQHLQDLRRQMELLQEEVESATLTPEYSLDSEDKRLITE